MVCGTFTHINLSWVQQVAKKSLPQEVAVYAGLKGTAAKDRNSTNKYMCTLGAQYEYNM